MSKVVCADILLFKCQSVNYANGLQGPLYKHILYVAPLCVHSPIYPASYYRTVGPGFNTISEFKYERPPLAAASMPLQYPSQTLRPSHSSSPVLFFLVVQLFAQRCYATLASFREGESTWH